MSGCAKPRSNPGAPVAIEACAPTGNYIKLGASFANAFETRFLDRICSGGSIMASAASRLPPDDRGQCGRRRTRGGIAGGVYKVQHVLLSGGVSHRAISDLIFEGDAPILVFEWGGSPGSEYPRLFARLDKSQLREFPGGDADYQYGGPVVDPQPGR